MSNGANALPSSRPAPPNRWLVLANVSLGTYMATLDGSIANVALPTMAHKLGAPIHLIQWVLTAYLLTICATLPIMGKLSDLIGRTKVYQAGFLLFAFGSALCGLSHSLGALIVSRIVQAVGASCLMSNSQAIVAETFGSGDRGRALGIVGTVVSLGSLTGPGIGGILVEHYGWPTIFWINVPIGAAAFAAGLYLLPKSAPRTREPFDFAGSGLFAAAMVAFLYTLSNAQDWGWTSAATIAGGAAALAAMLGFWLWERRAKFPMLDFRLYRIPAFAIGNLTALLMFTATFFTNVMMPFYLQNVRLLSPEKAGYLMMVVPVAMAVIAPLSGALSDRIGPNLLTTAGIVVVASGFVGLLFLTPDLNPVLLVAILCLFGLGSGLFQSPNNASIMGAVPKPQLGAAGGLNALVRNVGMVLGTSVSVSIYTTSLHRIGGAAGASDPQAMTDALRIVFAAGIAVSLLTLLVSVRRWRLKPSD
ncbi:MULTISPECIES: MFS transporter [Cohnella]|uniref:MFS transporter n=1 Tax=Cohnella TaxID=329857 RepID=UPI000E375728|nr:MFS transporter [Cohnella sp.]REK64020.1 MAG: MFS transporter [Cohnella sp.]